jgi:hypothetical protein
VNNAPETNAVTDETIRRTAEPLLVVENLTNPSIIQYTMPFTIITGPIGSDV